MTAHKPVRDTTREGAGNGAGFAFLAGRLKDARQGVESLVDPFGIVSPFLNARVAWGLHPMEFAELAMRYAADLSALQLNVGAKFAGQEVPDAVLAARASGLRQAAEEAQAAATAKAHPDNLLKRIRAYFGLEAAA